MGDLVSLAVKAIFVENLALSFFLGRLDADRDPRRRRFSFLLSPGLL